jgi:tRNA 2-thiouridine synthesizing protein D
MTTLLLLTSAPTSRLAWHACELARTMLNQQQDLLVFFYQDAVQVANQLTWRPADEPVLAKKWSSLNIDLPICVTAALARGITDEDNAKRHQLTHTNLAQGFRMAGLGELADAMLKANRIIQL